MGYKAASGEDAYKQHKKNGDFPSGSYWVGPQFKKHFKLLWTDFRPDEEVSLVFPAVCLENSSGFVGRDSGVACALTDQRFILAQKAGMKGVEKAIRIGMLTNVSLSSKMTCDEITVHAATERLVLRVSKRLGKRVYDAIQDSIGAGAAPVAAVPVIVQQVEAHREQPQSATDEVYRLKKLLDDGLISEDEFNALKRKALGL